MPKSLENAIINDKFKEFREPLIVYRKPVSVHIKNKSGQTPLMLICAHGRMEMAEELFHYKESEIDINACDNVGRTALDYAKESGHPRLAEILIKNGASQGEARPQYLDLSPTDKILVSQTFKSLWRLILVANTLLALLYGAIYFVFVYDVYNPWNFFEDSKFLFEEEFFKKSVWFFVWFFLLLNVAGTFPIWFRMIDQLKTYKLSTVLGTGIALIALCGLALSYYLNYENDEKPWKKTNSSIVLVALGSDGDALDDVEVIDLLKPDTKCKKPENFPYQNYWLAGGMGYQAKPLLCGGFYKKTSCHIYKDGAWMSSDSLNQERHGFAMTTCSNKLFITGGYSGTGYRVQSLSSSEILTKNGWQVSVHVPVTIGDHCMVTVDSSTVMVIGGNQNNQISGKTFFFNSETNIWAEGPTLKTTRYWHSCGSIRTNSQTQDKSLIAVAGYNGRFLKSVEVLDLDSNEWRRGPDLPFEIFGGALVEDPSGGVVIVGGFGSGKYFDSLYRLPHAGSEAVWELMPQKLKIARRSHTAFLVPREALDCN